MLEEQIEVYIVDINKLYFLPNILYPGSHTPFI